MAFQASLEDLVQAVSRHKDADHLVIRVAADRRLLEQVKEATRLLGRHSSDLLTLCRKYGISSAWFEERVRLLVRVLNLVPQPDDLYDILGLPANASEDDIKRAYRSLSRRWHPDLNPDNPDAAETFIKIKEAYQILSNPELRRHYDRQSLYGPRESFHHDNDAEVSKHSARRGGRRFASYLAGFVALLLAVTFLADFDDFLTHRYYSQKHYSRKTASQSGALGEEKESGQGLAALLYPFSKDEQESRRDLPLQAVIEPPRELAKIGSIPKKPKDEPAETRTDAPVQIAAADIPKPPKPSASPMETQKAAIDSASPTASARKESQTAKAEVQPLQKTASSSSKEQVPPRAEKPLHTPPVRPETKTSKDALEPSAPQPSKPPTPEDKPRAVAHAPNPKESPVLSQGITERDISAFLDRYCRTFSRMDLQGFLNLFTADACENGKPIGTLRHLYEKNFARTQRLDYRIRLERWAVLGDKVRVTGRFDLTALFHDRSGVHSNGTVNLTLVPRENGFQVSSLDYTFSNSERIETQP